MSNCPNCGAPIRGLECKYCGTSFRGLRATIPGIIDEWDSYYTPEQRKNLYECVKVSMLKAKIERRNNNDEH